MLAAVPLWNAILLIYIWSLWAPYYATNCQSSQSWSPSTFLFAADFRKPDIWYIFLTLEDIHTLNYDVHISNAAVLNWEISNSKIDIYHTLLYLVGAIIVFFVNHYSKAFVKSTLKGRLCELWNLIWKYVIPCKPPICPIFCFW